MRIAVVDIGTNSSRLLLADYVSGDLQVNGTDLVTTRLGEGIGRASQLSRPAMDRTVEALLNFRDIVTGAGADRIIVAATSAVRDAENRDEFLFEVKQRVGWEVRVLSGREEAELSYRGAVSGLHGLSGCSGSGVPGAEGGIPETGNPAVIDIGGGSTEFIWSKEGRLRFASKRVGAVRMTDTQATQGEIEKMLQEVLDTIQETGVRSLIGVGGTVTTAAAIDQKLAVYDPEAVHGYCLNEQRIADILSDLEGMPPTRRKEVPGLQPERADIIIAGLRILLAVVRGLGTGMITASETDIMHGLALSAAGAVN